MKPACEYMARPNILVSFIIFCTQRSVRAGIVCCDAQPALILSKCSSFGNSAHLHLTPLLFFYIGNTATPLLKERGIGVPNFLSHIGGEILNISKHFMQS